MSVRTRSMVATSYTQLAQHHEGVMADIDDWHAEIARNFDKLDKIAFEKLEERMVKLIEILRGISTKLVSYYRRYGSEQEMNNQTESTNRTIARMLEKRHETGRMFVDSSTPLNSDVNLHGSHVHRMDHGDLLGGGVPMMQDSPHVNRPVDVSAAINQVGQVRHSPFIPRPSLLSPVGSLPSLTPVTSQTGIFDYSNVKKSSLSVSDLDSYLLAFPKEELSQPRIVGNRKITPINRPGLRLDLQASYCLAPNVGSVMNTRSSVVTSRSHDNPTHVTSCLNELRISASSVPIITSLPKIETIPEAVYSVPKRDFGSSNFGPAQPCIPPRVNFSTHAGSLRQNVRTAMGNECNLLGPIDSEIIAGSVLNPPNCMDTKFLWNNKPKLTNPHENVLGPQSQPNSESLRSHLPSESQRCSNDNCSGSGTERVVAAAISEMSRHMIMQEIAKEKSDRFSGSATAFNEWATRIKNTIHDLKLAPDRAISYILEKCEGKPKLDIELHRKLSPNPTYHDVEEIWNMLYIRYAADDLITEEIENMLSELPTLTEQTFRSNILQVAKTCHLALKYIDKCVPLQRLNHSKGLEQLRMLLPVSVQMRWKSVGLQYEDVHGPVHPPFAVFVQFLYTMATTRSNSRYDVVYSGKRNDKRNQFKGNRVLATQVFDNFEDSTENISFDPPITEKITVMNTQTVKQGSSPNISTQSGTALNKKPLTKSNHTRETDNVLHNASNDCVVHPRKGHSTEECRQVSSLSIQDRFRLFARKRLCFRCLIGGHRVSNCNVDTTCGRCGSTSHHSLLHREVENPITVMVTRNKATKIKYSKVFLVDMSLRGSDQPPKRIYCIVDEQATSSLIDERALQYFGISFPKSLMKTKFATGAVSYEYPAYLVSGVNIKGVRESVSIDIPPIFTIPDMIDACALVASPDVAKSHPHASKYAHEFCNVDRDAPTWILLGLDVNRTLECQQLTREAPYVVKSPLGYALLGVDTHSTRSDLSEITALKTSIEEQGMTLRECNFTKLQNTQDVFITNKDDEDPGYSQNDKEFLEIMEHNIKHLQSGNLELPLPLKNMDKLPCNKQQVYLRTRSTLRSLEKHPERLKMALTAMRKNIDNGYVERAPTFKRTSINRSWYLPIFTVWNEKKGKIRLVFDASAAYNGHSLNSHLLSGPDTNNSLRGVLTLFREKPIAIASDVQDMFNRFSVPESMRCYQQFFWWEDNDCSKPIVAFHSNVHFFGATSSPAVANFALRYTSRSLSSEQWYIKNYINDGFYVDDGLYSVDSEQLATDTLKGAVSTLGKFGLKLHKFASNRSRVLEHFPKKDLASEELLLPTVDGLQRTLGLAWKIKNDELSVISTPPEKAFTKRGLLAVVNSIYDPLGLIAPVVLAGRMVQRAILPPKGQSDSTVDKLGWDDPLPSHFTKRWSEWRSTLKNLDGLRVPRSFYPIDCLPQRQEMFIFSDASQDALGWVAYLRTIDVNNDVHVAFVQGNSRLSPRLATTIPRMELNAAVEAARAASSIKRQMRNSPTKTMFLTDSTVVLAYLKSTSKRYTKYVERRVSCILDHSSSNDWFFISGNVNPADAATRPHNPQQLKECSWLQGPEYLRDLNFSPRCKIPTLNETLPEEVTMMDVCSTISIDEDLRGLEVLFVRTSNLALVLGRLKIIIRFLLKCQKKNDSTPTDDEAMKHLIRASQRNHYGDILRELKAGKQLPESHRLADLVPWLDQEDICRVGGRLSEASLAFDQKHPYLIPKDSALAHALVRHFHQNAKHQGRHITHGQLIQSGYFIEKGRNLIASILKECTICRRLRGKPAVQLMADLPPDRCNPAPPFTQVGMDVFGPFFLSEGRKSRKNSPERKVWVLLLVCLPSRAIHLELLERMDTSALLNALMRFVNIRGQPNLLRSDRGTNFIAASKNMEGIDPTTIQKNLQGKGINWIFNPPHSSHVGGAWERKIGHVRRVLEGAMALTANRPLNRDSFCTLLSDATNIVNHTPLWTVPDSPMDPAPLSPAMLLHHRDTTSPALPMDCTDRDLVTYGPQRYRKNKFLAEEFWKRWQRSYLQDLSRRHKWKTRIPCITKGDVVLIRDKNTARNFWPLARVLDMKMGRDGLVRTVKLKLPPLSGSKTPRETSRSIHELILLLPAQNHLKCNNSTS